MDEWMSRWIDGWVKVRRKDVDMGEVGVGNGELYVDPARTLGCRS